MTKAYLVHCYLNENRADECKGVFTEKDDGTYKLKLEFDDRDTYLKFMNEKKLINFDSEDGKGFIFEFRTISSGSRLRKKDCEASEIEQEPSSESMSPADLDAAYRKIYDVTFLLEYEIYKFAVGMNCFDFENLKFQQVICNFNNLNTWINGLAWSQIPYEEHSSHFAKRVYLPAAKDEIYKIDDNFEITVFIYGISVDTFCAKEKYDIYFKIKDGDFEAYFEKIFYFSKLITLLCNAHVEPKEAMTFFLGEQNHITIKMRKWVEEKELEKGSIISYNELKPVFEGILKGYFELKEKNSLPIDVLAADIYVKGGIGRSIGRFLNIAKAIENLYGKTLYDYSKTMQKNEAKKNKILTECKKAGVKARDVSYIKSKLDFFKGVSFETIVTQFVEDCTSYIDAGLDKKKLVSLVCATRNYYTHLETTKEVLTEAELDSINDIFYYWIIFRLVKFWNNENAVCIKQSLYNYIDTDAILKNIVHKDRNGSCKPS